jgi:hypothetical protein
MSKTEALDILESALQDITEPEQTDREPDSKE